MPINSLPRRTAALVAALALVIPAAACNSGDSPGGNSSNGSQGTDAAVYNPVSSSGTPPGGPLIPTDSEEAGRKTIIWLIFDGLVRVDTENKVVNEVAESITTDDAKTWTIKLKEGQKFANSEPVTADSFINAWTWGANIDNAQIATGDLAVIKGYDKLHPSEAGASPTATEFEGLTKVDDLTFTVELTDVYSSFTNLLTSTVFSPLPQAFFDDYDAWVKNPIGNGPYQLQKEVDESDGAYLEVNPNYTGTRAPENTGVYIRFYTNPDAIYQDVLADNLDIGSASGAGLLTAAQDFGDRFITGPGGPNQTLTFPLYDEFWGSADGLKVRQAISLAIDREEIIAQVFNGLAAPAREFTQEGLHGWDGNLPGSEILDFDPDKAKQLLEEAGGYPRDELPIYYNADGAHKEWVEAVANQLRANLGLNAVPAPITTFPEFLEKRDLEEFTGPWRASEIPFNPGLDDILRNVYSRAGSSSSGSGFESEEFEELLAAGRAQTSIDEANAYFNEAQEVLLRELPAIPLWYTYRTQIHSTKVSNVQTAAFGSTTYLIHKEDS
ncbi:MAG: ABC transporter substrate-binding protein [Bifidobacteriaceae bacterium]|jgi:oligopeptide transport system substrate-binding protein|nr:ABC transporter substrate-binding protein [Bifidobacteriaceae bacterium]